MELCEGRARCEWTEWHLGKLVKHYDARNAPSMHKRYNFNVHYDNEGSRGMMLDVANYKSDAGDAGLLPGTWVLLMQLRRHDT